MKPVQHTKAGGDLVEFCAKKCQPFVCNNPCLRICPHACNPYRVDGKLSPPLNEAANSAQKHVIPKIAIVFVCFTSAILLVCIIASILRVKLRISRRSASVRPQFFGTEQDFLDEDRGPEIDHPIWYINTIGLQQSVIDLIAVFRYKKDDGLIESSGCSVCLNEFQEDESLRLLPKCSHAFHIDCIDAWLRSHKNCPLCRAPIVSDNFDVQVDSSVPASSNLSRNGESQMENSENDGEFVLISNQVGEDGSSEMRNGDETNEENNSRNSKTCSTFSILRSHSRVRSDLVDRSQNIETEMQQPMRRSASLDSSSAMAIYNSVAGLISCKHQEKQLKHSKSKNDSKRGRNGSGSLRNLMKSSSIGHALQKAPAPMKRSFSSGWKSSSMKSNNSILPL